jgi:LmbE family N-acetylglucosaminyl deacetylase
LHVLSPAIIPGMRKVYVLFLLCVISIATVNAQDQLSSSGILQKLERLNVVGSVLYIAAHPDDENTRLLTYMNRERNLRTGYLSITRGDGGQNLIGKEQAEMLGLIRTQELLAARKIDGAEQFFTRANDFGYSKNPEETFRIWNKDSILSDMVWVIRNFKPDVIICRFPTTGEGGHGHHTASAILAVEAFDAAANPEKFSNQLKYVSTWQARRVFWNTFNFGTTNTTSPDQLQIDVGAFNPVSGKGVGEIAAESRSMHKSQGFGSAKTRGSTIEYFKLLKGDSAKKDLFEGIDQSWSRLKTDRASNLIEDCISTFDAADPSKSISKLVILYNFLQSLPDNDENAAFWSKVKLKETEFLILNCAGLWLEVFADSYFGIPGRKIDITAQIVNRNEVEIKLNKIGWSTNEDSLLNLWLKPNELYSFKHSKGLSAEMPYSGPYWLNNSHSEGLYNVSEIRKIGQAENSPAISVLFHLEVSGLNLKISRPLVYKSVDPIKGEIYRPFEVLPQATVTFPSKAFAFKNREARAIPVHVKSHSDSLTGDLIISVPEGWKAEPAVFNAIALDQGDDVILETIITPVNQNTSATISAELKTANKNIARSLQRIEYDHIPSQFMLSDIKAKLISMDMKQTGLNIGYIPGAGDDVAECLQQIGYNVTILSEDFLEKKNLSGFDAIVTGIRAFNTNEWLQNYDVKLLQYVKEGGNLIIQYNTNNRIGPLTAKIFPHPFTISRERVTDETAPVRFVKPAHTVLNFPNKISDDDFKGWVQERGIYFASEIDSAYEKILSINDPGEKANEGSLILAKYGKGNFVYTGLAFFRQLPAGNPGAYRLFVNLLSIPDNN